MVMLAAAFHDQVGDDVGDNFSERTVADEVGVIGVVVTGFCM